MMARAQQDCAAERDAEKDKVLAARVTAMSLKVGTNAAWWTAARAGVELRDSPEYLAVYGTDATRRLRQAHVHRHAQRKRFARQFAEELTGGLRRRTVDFKVVVVLWGAAVTAGEAVRLFKHASPHMYGLRVAEDNTSAACAGCKNQLVNVYPTARSPPARRQVWNGTALAESRKQQQAQGGGAGAKPVQPRRCATKGHRGSHPRRGGVERDAQKRAVAARLDEEWAAQRLEALTMRASGRDEKAAWSARKCVSLDCPVTCVNRDKNAARNIAGAGLAALSGTTTAPFFRGCRVRRPPRGEGPNGRE